MYIHVLTRENQGGEINTFSPLPDLSEPSMYTSTPGAVGPSLDDYLVVVKRGPRQRWDWG